MAATSPLFTAQTDPTTGEKIHFRNSGEDKGTKKFKGRLKSAKKKVSL